MVLELGTSSWLRELPQLGIIGAPILSELVVPSWLPVLPELDTPEWLLEPELLEQGVPS